MRIGPQAPVWLDDFDPALRQILHPAAAFDHPNDVVDDPDLTLEEKRAILSSWASDACGVESQPALRQAPGSTRVVGFDEVVAALQSLDRKARPRGKPADRNRSGNRRDGGGGIPLG